MAPSTQDDTATAEDAPVEPGPNAWHDRPAVLIATSVVGVVGLAALVVSVVAMSDHSAQPAPSPAPLTSVTRSTVPPAATAVVAPPPPAAPALPTATSAPHFAAGPTAETLVPPPPPPPGPAPFQLPPWLRRLLHQDRGPG